MPTSKVVTVAGVDTWQQEPAPRGQVHIGVLGPIELSFEGQALELGGVKTKALLVRLLIDHNLPIPVDSILDSLWPDSDQGRSEVTLRSMVSRLRQRLRSAGMSDEFIVTRPPGYMLVVDPDSIDAAQFERLVGLGRSCLAATNPTQASSVLSEALDLWRGPAYGEVRGEPFALAEARRLEELRIGAIEMRTDAELQLGHHHELVGEMEALTRAHWTRERLWYQRMLALYRCGRQAEALHIFQELRTILVAELGVEPGLEVSNLEHQILTQNPALDWVETIEATTAGALPPNAIPLPALCDHTPAEGFIGRDRERELLASQLSAVTQDGTSRLVFIGGEPGIGKTSLAMEFARQSHAGGAIVLSGRANEDFCAPYQPWAEALTHLVMHASDDLLKQMADHTAPLVHMVPRLADYLGTPETPSTTDTEAARYVWFGAVQGMLQAASLSAPVLLILDDLHWADVPSLRLLRHIVTSVDPSRVLIIGIYREFGPGAIHPLAQLLGDAHRMHNTKRIDLRGLNQRELQFMMERAAGQKMEGDGLKLRDALLLETDGNPFFVGEMLQHLVDTGRIYRSDGRWLASNELRQYGLPVSVREVIGQRVARLGDVARRVLTVASIIGRDFDYRLLATTCEIEEEELLNVLDLAIEADLIVNTGTDSCSFVHALVEHTMYDMVAPTRRAHIHRRIAEEIERYSYLQPTHRVMELAHHWAESNDPDGLTKAAGYARAAGDEALRQLAPDEALRWYLRALEFLGDSSDEELRCRLYVGVGSAQHQTGDPAFRETLLKAARLAQELRSNELLVAAALANSRGYFSTGGAIDTERVDVLEKACAAMAGAETADQARLLGLLAMELTFGGDLERRRALIERALDIARRCEPAALAAVGNYALSVLNVPDALQERLDIADEALSAAQTSGDIVLEFWCAYWRAGVLVQAGRVDEADASHEIARRIAYQLGQPTMLWAVTFYEGARSILSGDCEEAERLANVALELGTATGQPDVGAVYSAQLGTVRRLQGRATEILEFLRDAAASNPGFPAFANSLASFCVDLGQFDEARAVLEPFMADGVDSFPLDLTWLFMAGQRAFVVAELKLTEQAKTLFDALLPYADQIPFASATSTCQVAFYLGVLAASLDRHEEADEFFGRAEATHIRIGAKWCLASTWLEWGKSLARRPVGADVERAASYWRQVLQLAREEHYDHLAQCAEANLSSCGLALTADPVHTK
jgi:DNA-binding SARP family transcriptional activator/tetratricopeptide (TPR) repeat protein